MTATVVKVGGSLYDLPDLGPRLLRWLAGLDTERVLLVPGGGRTADVVRHLDRTHAIGESAAHWLALRSLALNAHFLAALLSGQVVTAWDECREPWQARRVPILDAHAFAAADEASPGALPHLWDVTSDSVAARVAAVGDARLVLLKSVTIPAAIDWNEAGERGFVDRFFARLCQGREVRAVNLRVEAT